MSESISAACLNLEVLLGEEVRLSTTHTNEICRKCAEKNENVVKRIFGVREAVSRSKLQLCSQGAAKSIKRLSHDNTQAAAKNPATARLEGKSKRSRALFTEATGSLRTRDVGTSTEKHPNIDDSVSSVEVSQLTKRNEWPFIFPLS